MLSAYFFVYIILFMIIPILPLFIEQLSGDPSIAGTLTGIIVAVTGFMAGISSIIFGRLGDKLGPRRIIIFSLIATGLISFPQAFAQTIPVLLIERFLLGFVIGGVMPSIQALISKVIPKEQVGSAFGLATSVGCLGVGFGPFIGGAMGSVMGLRVPFAFMGIFSIIIAIVVGKMIRSIE